MLVTRHNRVYRAVPVTRKLPGGPYGDHADCSKRRETEARPVASIGNSRRCSPRIVPRDSALGREELGGPLPPRGANSKAYAGAIPSLRLRRGSGLRPERLAGGRDGPRSGAGKARETSGAARRGSGATINFGSCCRATTVHLRSQDYSGLCRLRPEGPGHGPMED
jgi:hypothetical protein